MSTASAAAEERRPPSLLPAVAWTKGPRNTYTRPALSVDVAAAAASSDAAAGRQVHHKVVLAVPIQVADGQRRAEVRPRHVAFNNHRPSSSSSSSSHPSDEAWI